MSRPWGEPRLTDHRVYPLRVPDPAWFAEVVIGSVLREGPQGPFRIVRDLSRRRVDGRLMFVDLVIRHRSWTRRAYTVLAASDLKRRRFTLVPNVRVLPKRLMDVRIYQAIQQGGNEPYIVGADEVIGLP